MRASSKVEKRLREKIHALLDKRRGDYANAWRNAVLENSGRFPRLEHWKFRVLERQFETGGAWGLPNLVRAARYVARRLKPAKKETP